MKKLILLFTLLSSFAFAQTTVRMSATATGTDTYATLFNPNVAVFNSSTVYVIPFTNTNTSGTITLDPDGGGPGAAVSIKGDDGNDLSVGAIKSGGTYAFKFNGTLLRMIGSAGSAGGGAWGTITGTLSDQTDLQSALDAKTDGSGTTNELPYWVDSNTLGALAVSTYPSLTEFSYGKGVTSAIQTQLNTKAPYRLMTIASTPVINQPAYSSTLGYYIFQSEVSTVIPRMYLIPNAPSGDGTRFKFEGFFTDYASGSANYAGMNLFGTTAASAHTIHFGSNKGGTGTRSTVIIGSYLASSQEASTSELRMLTNDTWNLRGAGFNYESLAGTDLFGINSSGAWILGGSTGNVGDVPHSNGSGSAVTWSSPAVITSTSTSTAGATITLNMNSDTQLIHVGSATFATPKTVAMSNTSAALSFAFIFEVTDVAAVLTTPADWLMTTVDFDGVDWTPPATGRYKFSGTYNGTDWYVNANGPYN